MMRRDTITRGALDVDWPSADQTWFARLRYEGEIRFGPPYYALWISRCDRPGTGWWSPARTTLFGSHVAFSSDSRWLVIERWESLATPRINIVAIDLRDGGCWTLVGPVEGLPASLVIRGAG